MNPLYHSAPAEELSSLSFPQVEIFKTNVEDLHDARNLVEILQEILPGCKINFDLQDIDRILRIAGPDLQIDRITSCLQSKGYTCILLN